jgi:hypothetical protein
MMPRRRPQIQGIYGASQQLFRGKRYRRRAVPAIGCAGPCPPRRRRALILLELYRRGLPRLVACRHGDESHRRRRRASASAPSTAFLACSGALPALPMAASSTAQLAKLALPVGLSTVSLLQITARPSSLIPLFFSFFCYYFFYLLFNFFHFKLYLIIYLI